MEEKFKDAIKQIFAALSKGKGIEYTLNDGDSWHVGFLVKNKNHRSYGLTCTMDFAFNSFNIGSSLFVDANGSFTQIKKASTFKVDVSDVSAVMAAVTPYMSRFIECVSQDLDAL